MDLIDALGSGPVALDTAIFIYFVEEEPRFLPILEPIFQAIDRAALPAVTSALTLLETLVVPLRANDRPLAGRYEALLTRSRGLRMIDLDSSLMRTAAEIRALTRASTPDALQLAGALRGGATTFLTNDRRLPEIPSLRILQLSEFTTPR